MKSITIGRGSSNTISIEHDDKVSRRHCQITQDNNGNYRLIDLDSANGTYVNERRIMGEYYLNPNDTVRVGKTRVQWQNYFNGRGHRKPEAPAPVAIPVIPEHISINKKEEYAEVMKRGDDFKVPFFRNVGNIVGNTVGCLVSIIIVIIVLVIIGLIIAG